MVTMRDDMRRNHAAINEAEGQREGAHRINR